MPPPPGPCAGSRSIRPCRRAPFSRSARRSGTKALKQERTGSGMVRCCRFRSTRSGAQVLPFSIIIYT
jgi:hypothetical protein